MVSPQDLEKILKVLTKYKVISYKSKEFEVLFNPENGSPQEIEKSTIKLEESEEEIDEFMFAESKPTKTAKELLNEYDHR